MAGEEALFLCGGQGPSSQPSARYVLSGRGGHHSSSELLPKQLQLSDAAKEIELDIISMCS